MANVRLVEVQLLVPEVDVGATLHPDAHSRIPVRRVPEQHCHHAKLDQLVAAIFRYAIGFIQSILPERLTEHGVNNGRSAVHRPVEEDRLVAVRGGGVRRCQHMVGEDGHGHGGQQRAQKLKMQVGVIVKQRHDVTSA